MRYEFPKDFLWGCATSAYQVEGAASQDGRGQSVWDIFSHTPGKTRYDHNGDQGADQYNRFEEDIAIMKDLGLKAYRFSLSWSRIMPTGREKVNAAGLDYYHRLVDALIEADIEPWMTLFHWDLPQALQEDFGGWQSLEVADHFADFASLIAENFSDKVKNFFTINEFFCYTDQSYDSCRFAPGIKLNRKQRNQVRHNALLGHGKAAIALRESAKGQIKVGLAENPKVLVPVIETPENIEAAQKAMRIENSHFITAVLEGKYTREYLEAEAADAPEFTDSDMQIIGTKLDFVGINAYYPTYVRYADNDRGYEIIKTPEKYPTMGMSWIGVGPQIIYWSVRHLKDIWNVDQAYISENGCAATDKLTENSEVLDVDRIMYLREHFRSAHRCVCEGYPLKGYFVWSFIDNFEWADGYNARFGIVYVNYNTLQRIPKLSAEFYKEVIKQNVVV